jgi:glycerol kinase
MGILVIDVGTSSVRAVIVQPDATVSHEHRRPFLPSTPFAGLVEFDADSLGEIVLELAAAVLSEVGTIDGIGIANQRASALLWDRSTGRALGPGLGWQDLRTIGTCLEMQAHGFHLAPNASATKIKYLLDQYDPNRERAEAGELCFGTIDSWVAFVLSSGDSHITDRSNAAITAMTLADASDWHDGLLELLGVPRAILPEIVDSSGTLATAHALLTAPPILGMAGDQQASLVGQACVRPGQAKITFGTGGMLDVCLGDRPDIANRGSHGSFPIVAWQRNGEVTWGAEAIMLSAGTNIEWLRDDLGLLRTPAESHVIASQCDTTDGVMYVPALLGLGAPHWDYGARGALFGITRGTTRAHIVRAVLEGVAHRGADLVEAAEGDTGVSIGALRIDGGMSANETFVQALANVAQRPVEVSPVLEATALGAGFLAGMACGMWSGLDDITAAYQPRVAVDPQSGADPQRDKWLDAVSRARGWYPELSALDF